MANKQTGGTKLTGINPLSYMGVEPVSPPQLVRYQIRPTNRDFNFNIGDLWLVPEPFEVWMLLEKPQNVAFWALIYPQGGGGGGISLIHTGGPDVEGDVNGAISILGGENINTTASGPNTLIINLNRTIQWPTTNAAGTEGVIYLDGLRFMHNGASLGSSDANTFLGVDSGNFSLIGDTNTGIGASALTAITNGDGNTAVGVAALTALTVGRRNVSIGSGSGINIIGGDSNIMISNPGIIGDDSKIRIGEEGVQTNTFIAGITGINTTTVTPAFVMNVGTDGELGETHLISSDASITILQTTDGSGNNAIDFTTAGGGGGGGNPFAFSVVQVGDSAAIANGTDYPMGAFVALTKLFDVGNNITTGDGAGMPAIYTAPVTGKYYFELSSNSPTNATTFTQAISTTTHIYHTDGDWSSNTRSTEYSVITDMNMGDTATFSFLNPVSTAFGTYVVSGNGGSLGTRNINSTRISGFLIPESASGGNFSQPFLGIQQVDTNVDVVGGLIGPYALGSGGTAPLVEQFDVGNNYDSGNGTGIPATFTVPATGIYSFTIAFSGGFTGSVVAAIFDNGVQSGSAIGNTNFQLAGTFSTEFIRSLEVGHIITFVVNVRQGTNPAATFPIKVSLPSIVTGLTLTNLTYVSGYRIA